MGFCSFGHYSVLMSIRQQNPKNILQLMRKRFYSTRYQENSFFILTPRYYVNDKPHLGHFYTTLICDASQRFQSLLGKSDIIFSTGTDEYGSKIQQAAEKFKCSPIELCDKVSAQFRSLFDYAGINYTDYVRTTEDRHKVAVQHFFQALQDKGYIYEGNYDGWYCVPDESFLTDNQICKKVLPNGETINVSVESGHEVIWNSEKNYMFKLKSFQDDLLYWLKDESVVRPAKYHKELCTMIREGLQDLSISRPTDRVPWGISVPGDEKHNVYVWMDALLTYLTVVGYPKSNPTDEGLLRWPPDVQVLGKDILRFHGIYWPALLMAGGFEPPRRLVVHSHWSVDGEKMSKSKGNVLDPWALMNKFTVDGLRYVVLRSSTLHSDCSWNDAKAANFLNSELADTLGNLFSRCSAPTLNPKQEIPQLHESYIKSSTDLCRSLIKMIDLLPSEVEKHYSDQNFNVGIDAVMTMLRQANTFIFDEAPWKFKDDQIKLDSILHIGLSATKAAGICLQPIIPSVSKDLLDMLGISAHERTWKHINSSLSSKVAATKLGTRKILFNKLT